MRIFSLCLGLLLSQTASSEVLFEAFYRIEKDGKHTGYFIQRISKKDGLLTIQAYARDPDGFRSYQGVTRDGAAVSSIESQGSTEPFVSKSATFQGGQAIVKSWNKGSGPAVQEKVRVAKGIFPTAFLNSRADFGAMKPGKKYWYTHFNEARGTPGTGMISKLSSAPVNGVEISHLLNNPSGQEAESFVSKEGFVLASRSPATGGTSFWVKTRGEAVGDFTFPTNEFTKLFGDLPDGKKNPWHSTAGFSGAEVLKKFKSPVFDPRKRAPSAFAELQTAAPLPLRKAGK